MARDALAAVKIPDEGAMLQARVIPTLPPHPLTHPSPPLLVLLPSAQAEASARALQLPVHIVTDLGRTQARRHRLNSSTLCCYHFPKLHFPRS